jgi:hypothetical protein
MLDSRYVIIPFVLQVVCMGVDELYFHRQRGLPRWERLGHPLDTLTVLFCMLWILFVPPTMPTILSYVGLSIFSCFFITKDELIHHSHCRAGEHWLHAVLFVLHPVILISAGLLWPAAHQQSFSWLQYNGYERAFLWGNTLMIFGFGLYQFIYWNLLWKPVSANK